MDLFFERELVEEHAGVNSIPCPFRLTLFRFRTEIEDISSDEIAFHFLLIPEQGKSSGFICREEIRLKDAGGGDSVVD